MPATPENITVLVIELCLLLAGLGLLWHYYLRPAARAAPGAGALAPWEVPVPDFLLFVFLIIGVSLFASFAAGLALNSLGLPADTRAILGSAAFQFGLLLAPALLPLHLGHPPLLPPLSRSTLGSGFVTFLIALPVVTAVNLAWQAALQFCGLPVESQDLLRMFSQAKSPALLTLMIVLATLVAPVAEELLFRAVLFRYLRTRLSRWIALLLPGIVFASLHVNWKNLDGLASFLPLVTLAVVFSIAYERTGRIATAMVAHSLFNLHTILLLFAGVMG